MVTRKRKIQYEARNDYRHRCTRFLPALKLSGNWLAEYGFQIGDTVTIEAVNGQLTIRKLNQ